MSNQSNKTQDDALDQIRQLRESFDKKLSFENLRLSERYIEGEVYILVCFMIPGNAVKQCALFYREEGINCRYMNRLVLNQAAGEGKVSTKGTIHGVSIDCEIDRIDVRDGGCQQSMLIRNVESMKPPQTVIPSSVRFESVNSLFKRIGHSLCFSARLGFVLLGTLADREVNMGAIFSGDDRNQAVGEVVQSGSKVVDSITDKQGDIFRHNEAFIEEIGRDILFNVKLGSDFISVRSKENSLFPIQITDVLLGPFNFCSCSCQFGLCHENNLQHLNQGGTW